MTINYNSKDDEEGMKKVGEYESASLEVINNLGLGKVCEIDSRSSGRVF